MLASKFLPIYKCDTYVNLIAMYINGRCTYNVT